MIAENTHSIPIKRSLIHVDDVICQAMFDQKYDQIPFSPVSKICANGINYQYPIERFDKLPVSPEEDIALGMYGLISKIDDCDKFSLKYLDCIGMIAVGTDLISNRSLCFLMHVVPEGVEACRSAIQRRLQQLLNITKKDSIDVLPFGGNTSSVERDAQSFNILAETICEEIPNWIPERASAPQKNGNILNAFFSAQTRSLYLATTDRLAGSRISLCEESF